MKYLVRLIILFFILCGLYFLSIYFSSPLAQIGNEKIYYKTLKRNIKKMDPNFLYLSIHEIRKEMKSKIGLKKIVTKFLNDEAIWIDIQETKFEETIPIKYRQFLFSLMLGGYASQFFRHKIQWIDLKDDLSIYFNNDFWEKLQKSLDDFSSLYKLDREQTFIELKDISLKMSFQDIYQFFLLFQIKLKFLKITDSKEIYEKFKIFIKDIIIPRIYFIPLAYKNQFFERQVFTRMLNFKRKEYLTFLYEEKKKKIFQMKIIENGLIKKTQEQFAYFAPFFGIKKNSIKLEKLIAKNVFKNLYNDWLQELWKKYNIQIYI